MFKLMPIDYADYQDYYLDEWEYLEEKADFEFGTGFWYTQGWKPPILDEEGVTVWEV